MLVGVVVAIVCTVCVRQALGHMAKDCPEKGKRRKGQAKGEGKSKVKEEKKW